MIDAGHDITVDLMNAARAVIRARDAGRPVAEVLNQADMFGGEVSLLAKSLILNSNGQVASRAQIASRLERYAAEAQKNLAAPSMFGDVVKPSDVLRTALKNEGVETVELAPKSAALQAGPEANFDEGAAQRLRAASAATRARAQTFDQGPVGDLLRQRSGSADYRLPDSAVPGKLWAPGARGAETVQAYGAAAGSKAAIEEAAAESLRREAMTPEGIIDAGKFANWKKRYADAIRALPDDVRSTFDNAASASQAYEEAAMARKAAIDASQTTLAKRLAGLSNSQDITRTVGSIFGSRNAVEQMRELVDKLKGSPEALEGLKKAVADHIASLATGTTEAGASGINKVNASAFQLFVARNGPVLKAAGFQRSANLEHAGACQRPSAFAADDAGDGAPRESEHRGRRHGGDAKRCQRGGQAVAPVENPRGVLGRPPCRRPGRRAHGRGWRARRASDARHARRWSRQGSRHRASRDPRSGGRAPIAAAGLWDSRRRERTRACQGDCEAVGLHRAWRLGLGRLFVFARNPGLCRLRAQAAEYRLVGGGRAKPFGDRPLSFAARGADQVVARQVR